MPVRFSRAAIRMLYVCERPSIENPRLFGRALLEGNVTGFHLSLPLLKMIVGQPVTFSDLAYYDAETYKNLLWLLEHDGAEHLGLDFTVTEQSLRGETVTVELIPGGKHIDVTDANKHEYVERKFKYMVFESVATQLFAFLKGLHEVMPPEMLMMFDAEELDYLLSGSDEGSSVFAFVEGRGVGGGGRVHPQPRVLVDDGLAFTSTYVEVLIG